MIAASPRRARRPPPAGATLVELLVAVGLLAFMSLLLLGGLNLGTRAWERPSLERRDAHRLERLDSFLRQLLAQAGPQPPAAAMAAPRERAFEGAPGGLRFEALLPTQLGGGGRARFALQLDPAHELVLDWRPLAGGQGQRTVLLPEVERLEVAYLGREPGGRALRWSESWSGRDGLPALVRLRLATTGSAAALGIVLYYATRLGNETG